MGFLKSLDYDKETKVYTDRKFEKIALVAWL
jgi:hypothetical protein